MGPAVKRSKAGLPCVRKRMGFAESRGSLRFDWSVG